MDQYFGYPVFDREGRAVLTSTQGQYQDMRMNITVYHVKKGELLKLFQSEEEQAILLVQGKVHYLWEGREVMAVRSGFIKEGPYCLHVSRNKKVIIQADEDSELLVQATENERNFDSRFYNPADCSDVISGKGLCEDKAVRCVRTIFDYSNAPYSNMVMGEVISEQGGWTSYIPHHHPQPEVYYYRYERPEGFGACFIGDHAYKVTDRSFSAIPGGLTHPQVSAPGYPMYYVWMIRHLENNPWTDRIDDPRFEWLLH